MQQSQYPHRTLDEFFAQLEQERRQRTVFWSLVALGLLVVGVPDISEAIQRYVARSQERFLLLDNSIGDSKDGILPPNVVVTPVDEQQGIYPSVADSVESEGAMPCVVLKGGESVELFPLEGQRVGVVDGNHSSLRIARQVPPSLVSGSKEGVINGIRFEKCQRQRYASR